MRLPANVPVLVRPSQDPARAYDTQVGIARPIVLAGLGLDERDFVASLEGGREVTPGEARRFRGVLSALAEAGALAPARDSPVRSVAIRDCGPVADLIADACTAVGLHPTTHDRAEATIVPCVGAPEARDSAHLLIGGTPHVVVAFDEDSAWVSHVVVAGVTACARCRDHLLTASDAAWPYLAAQLAGPASRRPSPGGLVGHVSAARAAARLLAWFERGETGAGEIVTRDGSVEPSPLAAHPGCGCGAAGSVGDEVAARRARWRA